MKGRTPTADEKHWLNAISKLGCIVCWNVLGVYTPASPHHIDGKTKPGAHKLTIPLCGPHHQVKGSGWETRHHNKTRFMELNGNYWKKHGSY